MKEYKWATLGCGVIANQLAQAFAANGRKLYSVANRTHEKAVAFAEKYGIDKVYDQIDDVFSDDEVDIIYISTPHNTHISYLRKALRAGKHVLCEKSITLNAEELEEAVRLAEEHHVVLAEAMTIFHMPIYKELRSRMDAGDFGELRLLQMNFGSYKEYDMKNRFFNPESRRWSDAGYRCVCAIFPSLVYVLKAGSDSLSGKIRAYRRRRASINSAEKQRGGDGYRHFIFARQTAETGNHFF